MLTINYDRVSHENTHGGTNFITKVFGYFIDVMKLRDYIPFCSQEYLPTSFLLCAKNQFVIKTYNKIVILYLFDSILNQTMDFNFKSFNPMSS